MSSADTETNASIDCVRAAIEAARAGRADEFFGYFDPAVEFWMPGTTPISGRWNSREGFIEYAMLVFSYLSKPVVLEITNVIGAGDWVVTECTGHGVTRDGTDYDNVYCLVWRVRDGRIVRFTEYCDTDLVRQVLCR